MSWSSRYISILVPGTSFSATRHYGTRYCGTKYLGTRFFSIGDFSSRYLTAQKQIVLLQEIERLLAEETISELRSTSGGMAPPLLLDVAYIEALPRDHLTRVEEREVKAHISLACFP